jgi:hypothetical protein
MFDHLKRGHCPVGGTALAARYFGDSGKQKSSFPLSQTVVFAPTEGCELLRLPQLVLESARRFPCIGTCCASRGARVLPETELAFK